MFDMYFLKRISSICLYTNITIYKTYGVIKLFREFDIFVDDNFVLNYLYRRTIKLQFRIINIQLYPVNLFPYSFLFLSIMAANKNVNKIYITVKPPGV